MLKIATILPYKENYTFSKAAAASLWVCDFYKHSSLKKNTPVKIINPITSNIIETKIFKKVNYPKIFNVVISKKIATILELDINNPYVEFLEVKKNKQKINCITIG